MVTENYVSFEIAKLLNEKGFDAECHSHYYPCHYPDGSIQYHRDKSAQSRDKIWYNVYSLKNLPKDHYLAPTLQMAMKWLREEKHYYIQVMLDGWACGDHSGYYVVIQKTDSDFEMMLSDAVDEVFYQTYEEACEAAIKYCLENLI